jgi:peptidoglycan-N-acetylglucosamine deacetylase
MTVARGCVLLAAASLAVGIAWAQTAPPIRFPNAEPSVPARSPAAAATAPATAAPTTAAPGSGAPAAAPASAAAACPGNPNAVPMSRVVEIDTTGGPGFGFEHFKTHDFLKPGEVVLTFDDGPWPGNTHAVLAALASHCLKATFFPIGKHAMWHPEILKEVAAQGHSIGTHTWSHANLATKSIEEGKTEIEMGISAVHYALGGPNAAFFRFPALKHPPELVTYLGQRNIGIFSTDMDSFDFKMRRPEQVIHSVLAKLAKHGKGIVLLHDFQHPTSVALPELLVRLKANGYKIVHMRSKDSVQPIPEYDAKVLKEIKLPTVSDRPTSSVVRTISE